MDAGPILDFEQHLKLQLAATLPGPMVQRQFAPELALGRHRGPTPDDARQAAVLMLVHPADGIAIASEAIAKEAENQGRATNSTAATSADDWIIPAILRPAHMKYHPGQIAIPGGIVEPGETLMNAAVREFEEELGVLPDEFRVLGQLSPVYVFATRALVTPFVAFAPVRPSWRPNADEVAAVVDIRLAELLSPAARGMHTIRRGRLTMRAPHFEVAGRQIWGATAMILAEFAAICSAARLHLWPEPPKPTPDAT